MFSSTEQTPLDSGHTASAAAIADVLSEHGLGGKKALGESTSVKLTNADVMMQSMVAKDDEGEEEEEDDIYEGDKNLGQSEEGGGLGFTIFEEDGVQVEDDKGSGQPSGGGLGFAIFQDDGDSSITPFDESLVNNTGYHKGFEPPTPTGFFDGGSSSQGQEISRIEGGMMGGLDIPVFEDESKEGGNEEEVAEGEAESADKARAGEGSEEEEEDDGDECGVIEYDELYARQINNSVKDALKDVKTVFDCRNKSVNLVKKNGKPQVVRMGGGGGRGKGSLSWNVQEFLGEGANGQVFFVENKGT